MKTGLSFSFDHRIGFEFGLDMMSHLLSKEFNQGQVAVFVGDEKLGVAGQLAAGADVLIPRGSTVNLVVDLPPEKAVAFKVEVEALNNKIDPRNKAFGIV